MKMSLRNVNSRVLAWRSLAAALVVAAGFLWHFSSGHDDVDSCLWIPHDGNAYECVDHEGHVFGSVSPETGNSTDFRAEITDDDFDDYRIRSHCSGSWNDDTSAMRCLEDAIKLKKSQR